jgi:ABC-type branched-subunit amino acid transport system substrate-binding protein
MAERRHAANVAVNLPLSGDLAVFGVPIQRGFTLGQEELGRLPESFSLNIDWQDNRGNGAHAVSIGAVQTQRSPDIYVSGLKPQTLAIVDRITNLGIPHFIWAWDSGINQVAPNTLRTWLNFSLEASVIRSYCEKIRPARVAILYVQIPGNTEAHYRHVVAPDLKSLGIDVAFIDSYPLDQVDFRTTVLRLSLTKPDLYIINGFPHQLIGLIRALRQMNLMKPGNTFASMDVLDAAESLSADELNEIVTAAPEYLVGDVSDYKSWKASFTKRFGEAPTYHAAFGYDQAYIIYDAALRIAPGVSWRDAILRTDRKGVTGRLRFDQTGSLIVSATAATFDKNKKLKPVQDNNQVVPTRLTRGTP